MPESMTALLWKQHGSSEEMGQGSFRHIYKTSMEHPADNQDQGSGAQEGGKGKRQRLGSMKIIILELEAVKISLKEQEKNKS